MKRLVQLIALTIAVCCLLPCSLARTHTQTRDYAAASTRPHCGINICYALLRLYEKNLDYRSLLVRQYLSSAAGSTTAQLLQLLKDHGLHASVMNNLWVSDLKRVQVPSILHVKADLARSQAYDHWILCLGAIDDSILLYDPPNEMRVTPLAEVAPRWDGSALLVSNDALSVQREHDNLRVASIRMTIGAVVIIVTMAILLALTGRPAALASEGGFFRNSMKQALTLGVIGSCLGVLFNMFYAGGLLVYPEGVRDIATAATRRAFRQLDQYTIRRLSEDNSLTIIDARFPSAFIQGHLDNAVNISVNASFDQRRDLLKRISKEAPIVVYSGGPECRMGTLVAARLVADGYHNVYVYPGGWQEWHEEPS